MEDVKNCGTQEAFYVIGVSREGKPNVYVSGDGSFTPALYRAFRYPEEDKRKAEEDADLLTKSITSSYGRYLEQVRENAMYPVYGPGLREIHESVYNGRLDVFYVQTKITKVHR